MPTMTKCEVCGAEGAKRVEAALTIVGEVIDGQPTSTVEAVDACAKCRPKVLAKLFEHVRAEFEEQVPYHDRLMGHVANMEELSVAARLTAEPLLAHAARYELIGKNAPPADADAVAKHQVAVEALDSEDAERRATAAEATAASDARKAAFRESLTK